MVGQDFFFQHVSSSTGEDSVSGRNSGLCSEAQMLTGCADQRAGWQTCLVYLVDLILNFSLCSVS